MPRPDFDVLSYSRDLEAAGFSRQQADVIARGMTRMLSQQLDALVTREHFDLTVVEFDRRFAQVYRRFDDIDRRFEQVDRRFEQVDQRFDKVDRRFEQVDQRFRDVEDRLTRIEKNQVAHTTLLTITTLAVVIPLVQSLTSG